MLDRSWVVALNTYREAVRARILHGLLGLALATLGYSLVVSAYTLSNQKRAVVNLGNASISVYAIVVALLLGATSLYRELEFKTIFPILARPLHRAEYLLGKFVGTWLVVGVFVAANAGLLLLTLHSLASESVTAPALVVGGVVGTFVGVGLWRRALLTWLPIPAALLLLVVGWVLAREQLTECRVVGLSALLTFLEVGVVIAVSLVMASFSSPFLSALFTLGIVVVGRSADALARLPKKIFGDTIHELGLVLSRVFPNLMVYVPPSRLLSGEMATVSLPSYFAGAAIQALAWIVGLLAFASFLFRRRDFL